MPAEAPPAAPPPSAPAAAPATPPAPIAIPSTPPTSYQGGIRRKPAFEKMAKELEAKGQAPQPSAPQPPTTENKPQVEPKPEAKAPEAPKPGDAPKPSTDDAAPDPKLETSKMPPEMDAAVRGENGKVQPWKLANWYKDRFADAQAEIAKLRTNGLAEQEKQQYLTRLEQAEKKAKEFEDEMRLTNYAKSSEFQEKYQKPYDAAWKRTMHELNGLTTQTADGDAVAFTAQDMLQLVNMDAIPARKMAQELYGEFANDVMLHRNEIRRMADEQAAAIEEAKTTGAQREKERMETHGKTVKEIQDNIQKTFKEAFQAAQKDEANGRFFVEREGDEEWNTALEKGRQLSKSVFAENPEDPKLTPQQRAEIVRRHAAVFNRSAAFGPLKRDFIKLEKKYAEVLKELEGFKSSRPDAASGSQPNGNGSAPMRAKDRVFGELAKMGR